MANPLESGQTRPKSAPGAVGRANHAYPMLGAGEEVELIAAWQENRDTDALHRLVTSHLRLVSKIARGFNRYDMPLDDLISEGSTGLIQAIDRFDLAKGFRLSTYAKWWIRAAIQEYVMRSWSLVRVGTTVGQKKLFFNLGRMKRGVDGLGERQLTPAETTHIAERLKLNAAEVESMDRRMGNPDCSLNELAGDDGATEWLDQLADPSDDQETAYAKSEEMGHYRDLIGEILAELLDRDRQIFIARRLSDDRLTLAELATQHHISPERVRQIEHAVFELVSETLKKAVAREAVV